jgi:hypothetical protein
MEGGIIDTPNTHFIWKLTFQCLVNTIVLLRDDFHIGLVIGPRPAVLAPRRSRTPIQQTEDL